MDHRLSDPHAPSTPLTDRCGFEFECPITVFKADDAPEGKKRRIAGIISTDSVDRQKERILQDGLTFDDFLANGWLNDNHNQDITAVLGYPESVKQFDKGQVLPNGTAAEANCTWVEGYLLDTPKANEIWQLAQALSKTHRRLGYSVEGQIVSRSGPGQRTITKAKVRNVAITHCFPGDVRVLADVQGVSRRHYKGAIIDLELAGGYRVSGTPNHPVLTQRGWVGLGEVDETLDVVGRLSAHGVAAEPFVLAAADDVQQMPPTLEEVFSAAQASGGVEAIRVGHQHDFHGDGAHGEVNVVTATGLLGDRLKAAFDQHFCQDGLSVPEATRLALAACSSAADPRVGVNTPQQSLASQLRAMPPLLWRSCVKKAATLSRIVSGYAKFLGDVPDHLVPHPVLAGQGHARDALSVGGGNLRVEIGRELLEFASRNPGLLTDALNLGNGDVKSAGDFAHELPAAVQFDSVVSKRVSDFSGHVYNLEAKAGWFIADGLIVKNCPVNTESFLETLARSISAQDQIFRRSMTINTPSGSAGPVKPGTPYRGDQGGGQVLSKESLDGVKRKKRRQNTNRRLSRSEAVAYVKSLLPHASEALARALVASTKFQRGRGTEPVA